MCKNQLIDAGGRSLSTAKDMVLDSLRAKRVATYEIDPKGDSIAIVFLQSNIFFDIVSAVNALGGIRVDLVREAPRWIVIRGSHSEVESAVGCCKSVLRDPHSTSVITGRFADIISCDNDQCVLECSLFKVSSLCVHANIVDMISTIPPWVDECTVRNLFSALEITPARCSLRKGGERSTVEIGLNQVDAKEIVGVKLVLPIAQRQVRFAFEYTKPSAAFEKTLPATTDPMDVSVDSLPLDPLPRSERFVNMTVEDKRAVLETAFQERLSFDNDDDTADAATTIVRQYHGSEHQLYDMLSDIGAQAIAEQSKVTKRDLAEDASQHHAKPDVNDIIEIGRDSGRGVLDTSLVFRIMKIQELHDSIHVDGCLLSTSGKDMKLCEMLLNPPYN